jgi:ribosomal protein S18 acetylase RimI-like enzyme
MPSGIELCDDGEHAELEAFLAERIHDFNTRATGYFDAKLLGGRVRDGVGKVIGAFNGHTWGGCCVIAHIWVHRDWRGRGIGREMMRAAENIAARRGCEKIVLSSHDFQAPGFYERLGYERQAVILGWPRHHADILYAKPL